MTHGLIIFLLALFLFPLPLFAESGQLLLTWQAQGYTTSLYPGKTLPTPRAPVAVSLALLRNSVLSDLSSYDIRWDIDGKPALQGAGEDVFTFTASSPPGSAHLVRVSATAGEETLQASVSIPVTPYRIAIQIPHPHETVLPNTPVILTAVPYFFPVSSLADLRFFWQNDSSLVPASIRDNVLILPAGDLPLGKRDKRVVITASFAPIDNLTQTARERKILTVGH